MSLTYKDAGVDQDKAENILASFSKHLKGRPKDPNLMSGIGPYASCYSLKSLLKDYSDPVLVTCCDGVGTKAKLALDWEDITTLGEDLVAMNVNDLLCVGANPLVFLDYYACGKLEEAQLLTLLKSIQKGCELSGCALAGGETAEMPGIYQAPDFDLGGFSVGMVERSRILGGEKIAVGHTILAVESTGPHSNGYSLIRKIVEREKIKPGDLSPFDNRTWREVLLAPTRIYVPYFQNLLSEISGLAHITGGGLLENLPRIFKSGQKAVVHSKDWPMPPLFKWLQDKAGLSEKDLLTTFNCGVGMVVTCPPGSADRIQESLETKGLKCWAIGEVAASTEPEPFVEWR